MNRNNFLWTNSQYLDVAVTSLRLCHQFTVRSMLSSFISKCKKDTRQFNPESRV